VDKTPFRGEHDEVCEQYRKFVAHLLVSANAGIGGFYAAIFPTSGYFMSDYVYLGQFCGYLGGFKGFWFHVCGTERQKPARKPNVGKAVALFVWTSTY